MDKNRTYSRMPKVNKGLLGLVTAALLAGVSSVHAAPLDGYQQGLPKQKSQQVRLTPQAMQAGSQDESVLVPEMKGVAIVSSPDEIVGSGVSAAGVSSAEDAVPAIVQAAAAKYVGKPISLANLDRMTRDMVLAFRSAGMPVVNVVVPPQDITAGSVQVIAVVGRLGETNIEGNASDPNYYREGLELQPGEVVSEAAVLDHLRWKSRRSHRNVTAIYSPGASFSQTDVTFDVNEKKPWSVFTGVDNTGNSSVGDYRIFAGVVVGNLWNLDHELSYQFTTSEEGMDGLGAHVLSYTLPVPFVRRTDLNILGSYVDSQSQTGTTSQSGESYSVSANFHTQLPRFHSVSFDARYGFEYKNSNNDLEFGGTTTSSTETEIGQFYAQLQGQKFWSWGHTSAKAGVWVSPGGLFGDNDDAAFGASRQGASAEYAIFRAGIEQMINLPKNFMMTFDIQGQLATERLIASEMLYLGGMRSVRGFGENVAKGDHGVVGRVELNSPGIPVLGRQMELVDQLRAFAFLDAGTVSYEGTAVAGDDNVSIAGAGLGLKYQIADRLDAQVAYGWNIHDDSDVEADDGALHFRVVVRY